MGYGIGVKLNRDPTMDPAKSKFFGDPALPLSLVDSFNGTTMFLCQVCLEDIALFDPENRLPHQGMAYVFLDTVDGKYNLKPIVLFTEEKPEVVVDSFNEEVPGFEQYTEALAMTFSAAAEDAEGIRFLGVPSDWNYPNPAPELFLQLDPYDEDLNFLSELDGFIYFFFGRGPERLTRITLMEEFS